MATVCRCGTGWKACGTRRCCGPHDTCTDAGGWGACCPNGTTPCGSAGLCCNAGEECTPGNPIFSPVDAARCARMHVPCFLAPQWGQSLCAVCCLRDRLQVLLQGQQALRPDGVLLW